MTKGVKISGRPYQCYGFRVRICSPFAKKKNGEKNKRHDANRSRTNGRSVHTAHLYGATYVYIYIKNNGGEEKKSIPRVIYLARLRAVVKAIVAVFLFHAYALLPSRRRWRWHSGMSIDLSRCYIGTTHRSLPATQRTFASQSARNNIGTAATIYQCPPSAPLGRFAATVGHL